MTNQPIGVIDSGIGGLTVWQELVKIMPHEAYFYFGDSGFCPYGSKDARDITRRVKKIVDCLIENRCKLIVIACNAITASSIEFLRGHFAVPFIGMEPAIKPALMNTKTGAIGVLATEQTLIGDTITVLNPAPAVAQHTADTLGKLQLRSACTGTRGQSKFYTTGSREILGQVLCMMNASGFDVESIMI